MTKLSEIRAAVEQLKEMSVEAVKGKHLYRVDRGDASSYFYGVDEWRKEVMRYIKNISKRGETPAFLDVCGTTSASSLGCNMNYQFTIQKRSGYFNSAHTVPIVGDLFSRGDFDRVVMLVKENGHLLSLTTFQPMAGLQRFTPKRDTMFENVVYRHLIKQLTKIVEITRDGGYILLERPFQLCPHHIRDCVRRERTVKSSLHTIMKCHARSLHCKIRVVNTLNGPLWLLCKGYAQDRRT